MSESRQDNRPAALTGLEHGTTMFWFAKQFPRAVKFSVGSSPTEHFLANTSAFPFVQQAGNIRSDLAYTNLSLVSADVFSRRLSVTMNTFYQLSMQPPGILAVYLPICRLMVPIQSQQLILMFISLPICRPLTTPSPTGTQPSSSTYKISSHRSSEPQHGGMSLVPNKCSSATLLGSHFCWLRPALLF